MERITREITDAIKCLYDLTARTDERVKMLVEKNRDIEQSVTVIKQSINEIANKVTLLERASDHPHLMTNLTSIREGADTTLRATQDLDQRLKAIESKHQKRIEYWKIVFDYVLRTIWNLWICWVLYKFHLQGSPIE